MDVLKGYVSEITYSAPNTAFKVLKFQTDDSEEIVVGSLFSVSEGEMLEINGEWTVHPIYGKQFKALSFTSIEPGDEEAMIRYLGSGLIKGVGPTLAKRIVKEFGKDTFKVIEEQPERLERIKGITMRKAQEIGVMLHEKRGYRDALMLLQKFGIGNNLALKIYSVYQDKVYRILEENPYRIAEDITGVGFKTADDIAKKAGVKPDSDYRIRSGILYTLLLATNQGNMYLLRRDLVDKTSEIIGVAKENIEPHIDNLALDRKIVLKKFDDEKDPAVYARSNFEVEKSVAARLRTICDQFYDDEDDIEYAKRSIDRISKENDIELETLQREAVLSTLSNGVTIITGGPGTGKTTTINTLIKFFEERRLDIELAAPTGRAAKRMTEATGYEARTLHRMLELNGSFEDDVNAARFARNEQNPIDADVVIVDEMSMVDIFLFNSLLKAIASGSRLILCGDADQLPSVGPGQVLRDLIESGCIPVTKLEKIYRQEGNSDIVVNAHRINKGESVSLNNESKDFFFLKRDDAERILANTVELVTGMLPGYVNATPFDIQVITPTRKGTLGVEAMNVYLRDRINPPSPSKKEYLYRETLFREGDKVMQIKNNYKAEWEVVGKYNIPIDAGVGVFNGDLGRIIEISEPFNRIKVEFDDKRRVDYQFSDLDELELAYAITVHKSQGSEYEAVVMPIMGGPKQLLNRNLLYTAVTRARQCLVLMGSTEVLDEMIANNHVNRRYSGLKDRIVEVFSS
jgi:exodeoxyribonuclease V alpha subunit